jgi:hypothetical protein
MAVFVLGSGAGFIQEAKSRGWLLLIKKPLPIRKPLRDLDRQCTLPFRLKVSQRFPAEIEAELGTKEYVNWVLDLPRVRKVWSGDVILSVTYYTGKQDQVPHVSEECLVQQAFSPSGDDTLDMEMTRLGRVLPIRRLSFYPPRQVGTKTYVYYSICVNNDFYPGRQGARLRMANMGDTHLYYSKMEVSFGGVTDDDLSLVDQYAQELLDGTLTELMRSHWPLKGWERGGPTTSTGSSASDGLTLGAFSWRLIGGGWKCCPLGQTRESGWMRRKA